MLVRVGNLCGILQRINALLMVFEVPYGRGFDIHTVRPCLSACCEHLSLHFFFGRMHFRMERPDIAALGVLFL